MIKEIKLTEAGKSYWDGTGAYQTEYENIYGFAVPSSGSSLSLKGELVRAISRLVYEHCNNGNCNAREVHYETDESSCWGCGGAGYHDEEQEEECYDCCGSGYVEEEYEADATVSEFYDKFLMLIEEHVTDADELTEAVRNLICEHPDDFSEKGMATYNILFDTVMAWVVDPANPDVDLTHINYEKD
jgi:hypothetical protein